MQNFENRTELFIDKIFKENIKETKPNFSNNNGIARKKLISLDCIIDTCTEKLKENITTKDKFRTTTEIGDSGGNNILSNIVGEKIAYCIRCLYRLMYDY